MILFKIYNFRKWTYLAFFATAYTRLHYSFKKPSMHKNMDFINNSSGNEIRIIGNFATKCLLFIIPILFVLFFCPISLVLLFWLLLLLSMSISRMHLFSLSLSSTERTCLILIDLLFINYLYYTCLLQFLVIYYAVVKVFY